MLLHGDDEVLSVAYNPMSMILEWVLCIIIVPTSITALLSLVTTDNARMPGKLPSADTLSV